LNLLAEYYDYFLQNSLRISSLSFLKLDTEEFILLVEHATNLIGVISNLGISVYKVLFINLVRQLIENFASFEIDFSKLSSIIILSLLLVLLELSQIVNIIIHLIDLAQL
jgi:hypothetical protein